MYTVYDFVNSNIEPKHMKFGWKVEINHPSLTHSEVVLRYTMLNFDWKSLEFIGNDLWNMFLSSESYKSMSLKLDRAKKKHKRLYFSAFSIDELKSLLEDYKIFVNVDKLISSAILKRSKTIKEQHKNRLQNN